GRLVPHVPRRPDRRRRADLRHRARTPRSTHQADGRGHAVTTSPLPPPGAPTVHYVSAAEFDPKSIERLTKAQEKVYFASQWRLMWWKFRRHRLALISGIFLIIIYASILVSEVLAPYELHS